MKIKAVDKNGSFKEYDAILTYHSDEFNKDYVVYTDNIYNDSNELQIYINEYTKETKELVSNTISDPKEYNKIKIEVNRILLTLKNETDKFKDN